jgi:MFS family permease
MYRPAVSAAIADLVEPEDRVRAFGLLYWAVNLGFAVSGMLGGLLAQRGWMLLFWGDAITTLCFAAVIYSRIPETKPAHAEVEERLALAVPLSDRPFMLFVLLTLLVATMFLQCFSTLPVDMRAHGVSPAHYGTLIALNGVLIVIFQPFAANVLEKFPRHRVLAAAAVLAAVGFGLTGLVHTEAGYALSIAVWTAGEITMAGIGPTVVSDLAPPHLRGAYQGMYQSSWGGASLLAPLLGSLVLGAHGSQALWFCCFCAGLVAAVGQLLLGPNLRAEKGVELP